MARLLEAKCHVCRRAGTKLFLKGERCYTSKCAIVKRNYPPGVAGAKQAKPRLTSYGTQLREKQKAKNYYRVSETQFRHYFEKAVRKVGNTADNMISMLEMRLDNVIYRLGWGGSHDQARQFVSHGMIRVNGHKVDIASYQVAVGDIITLKPKAESYTLLKEALLKLEKKEVAGWLFGEKSKFEAKVVSVPTMEEAATVFDTKSIIEFYSR